jgi:uncharacterized protein (TIGR03067 family)
MKRFGVCAALVVVLGGLAARAADSSDDKKNMQGKWTLSQLDEDGKAQEVGKDSDKFFQIEFGDGKVTVEFKSGKEEGTYKIDPTQKVKTIDITANTGADKGKTLLGIYSLDGDTLKVCMAEADAKERPTEFKGKKDKITVYVLKRVK